MILVKRAAGLIVVRRYSTDTLQHRIARFLRSLKHTDPSYDPSWHSVAILPTLDSAAARLESIARPSTRPEESASFPLSPNVTHPPPTWLLVRLCSKVQSPADAEKASHVIITYLPYVPSELHPPVLLLMVHLLSTYKVLRALDRVVRLFIGLPIFHEHWHFNRLLRALSHYTYSPTDGRYVARLAVLLLKTMTERKLFLTKKTYRLLLENRFITVELSEELRQRMIRDKIVPDRAHLESLLRISVNSSSLHDAAVYARAIRRLDRSQDGPPKITSSKQSRPPGSETDQIIPSTTVDYLTHLLHENSQRTQFDADAEWLRFTKTGQSHRFLNKQKNTSAAAWAARLVSLSTTPSFSPENLVAFFDWSHAQHFPFRTHTTLSYTILLRGLLSKCAFALALEVWERYRRHGTRKLHLDMIALRVGVEVLTRAGHPERALTLIKSLSRRTPEPLIHAESTSSVSIGLVNHFMRVLSVTNPSAALRLWEHMGILYAVTPDAFSFTIMLNAARQATLNGDSFAGAIQELGFDLRFRLPFAKPDGTIVVRSGMEMISTIADTESLDNARRRSYAKLENSLAVNEGDLWGGERAWRRAYRIFTSALLAGWPALANVQAPAHAIRSSGESPATAPFRDLKRFLAPPPHNTVPSDEHYNSGNDFTNDSPLRDSPHHNLLPLTPLLPTHAHGAYLSFVPDDGTFRAAVLLLGVARCASQIPQVLAWMRALGIKPRTHTLAYALVFWAEVSIGAPLLERLRRRGEDGGEYVRLVRWMEAWVGVENLPDEAAVGEAMRKVDAIRRGPDTRR